MRSVCLPLFRAAVVAAAALLVASSSSFAQEASVAQPRVFAPGVLEVIPIDLHPEETTSVHDIVELRANRNLNWTPKLTARTRTLYSKSESVRFRRDVWQLEFAFKPLRMIHVQIPNAQGEMERRLVWYLVYRVTNRGDAITPTEDEGGLFTAKKGPAGPQRFVPHFVLEGQDVNAAGTKIYRAYLDRLIPAAIEPIRRRETPGRKLLTTTQMAEAELPVSTDEDEQSLWGVATWVDIDPEMDFFSVFVRGLTNAYQWQDPRGAARAGDPPGTGRTFARKTLQLNFWRPGDRFMEHESEVRFGVAPGKEALYGVAPGVAHQWVYR